VVDEQFVAVGSMKAGFTNDDRGIVIPPLQGVLAMGPEVHCGRLLTEMPQDYLMPIGGVLRRAGRTVVEDPGALDPEDGGQLTNGSLQRESVRAACEPVGIQPQPRHVAGVPGLRFLFDDVVHQLHPNVIVANPTRRRVTRIVLDARPPLGSVASLSSANGAARQVSKPHDAAR
jgi:hypothetical protein